MTIDKHYIPLFHIWMVVRVNHSNRWENFDISLSKCSIAPSCGMVLHNRETWWLAQEDKTTGTHDDIYRRHNDLTGGHHDIPLSIGPFIRSEQLNDPLSLPTSVPGFTFLASDSRSHYIQYWCHHGSITWFAIPCLPSLTKAWYSLIVEFTTIRTRANTLIQYFYWSLQLLQWTPSNTLYIRNTIASLIRTFTPSSNVLM